MFEMSAATVPDIFVHEEVVDEGSKFFLVYDNEAVASAPPKNNPPLPLPPHPSENTAAAGEFDPTA